MTEVKVHLGCWHRVFPGYLHVDLCDFSHIDHKARIDELPFLSDNSVDLIYCSHALEYFDNDEASRCLAEWRRVLKCGGVLRLSVPNFDALIKIYQNTGDITKVIGPLFGKMTIPSVDGQLTLYSKTVYCERSLRKLLLKNGFGNPELWDWRLTEHAMIDDHSQAYFPHLEKQKGLLISLNMQAVKVGKKLNE